MINAEPVQSTAEILSYIVDSGLSYRSRKGMIARPIVQNGRLM